MFDVYHPAADILELVEYLKSTHSDKVVYRGQSKDYNTLLPSFYRKKISTTRFDPASGTVIGQYNMYNHFLEYNPAQDSQQNIAKRVTMNHLMASFGKSLGNVIAQQYGINSECLDVTSDLDVAAFFATHSWPHYDTVLDSPELGVIYRIPCMRGGKDHDFQHAGTELALSSVFLSSDRKPIPLLFSSFRYQHTTEEFDELNRQYQFTLKHTVSKPLLYNASNFRDIVYTYFSEKYPQIDIASLYSNTRMNRQKAGFFIPSFVFESYVPSNLKIFQTENIQTYSPSFVIHKEKVVIEDILTYPGIERYYFRHNPKIASTYSREYLWPTKEEDYFYNLLYRWCSDGCRNYIDDRSIEIDDMNQGVLDRGFYI